MVYILHEHALGYILMKTEQTDKVLVKETLHSLDSFSSFKRAFSLVGTLFFSDSEDAQHEIECTSEGQVSKKLQDFLEINNVKSLAADRSYTLSLKNIGIKIADEETSLELLRAVRKFADKLLEVEAHQTHRPEASLAHLISRKKIKFDNKREDNSVMQCISLIDELDIDINDYYMKVKEMYSWHFPELAEMCTDAESYLAAVDTVGNRHTSNKEEVKMLEHGEEILEKLENTIGGDLTKEDLSNIKDLTEIVVEKVLIRKKSLDHLNKRMSTVAPNLSALIGNIVGARLILKAGGLSKLALCAASTIQVLGAEKALFRAMKTKSKTPKYGLIFTSSFVNKSSPKLRGRISRYLSAKCALASRIDCYEDKITDAYGVAMREMVEERAKGKSMHNIPTDMVLAKVFENLKE